MFELISTLIKNYIHKKLINNNTNFFKNISKYI